MSVNDAVTDSVTQVNTMNVGTAPGSGQGNLQMAVSHALSGAAWNAESNNQQSAIVNHTATIQNLNALFSQGASITARILSNSAGDPPSEA
ncbi:RebB family R body protein [Oceanospirillum sediminis]|uniref:RebB family R body protein n=1 Tax=Oceanospirillum sediminis TaxID=2760088 RepID=A0A839ISS2_9GAMM|nr:RebB family R body protein [Oceanospirillum sediminis]MBB1487714.1 RebB family R body protein [Oceanospirillum sediminis]